MRVTDGGLPREFDGGNCRLRYRFLREDGRPWRRFDVESNRPWRRLRLDDRGLRHRFQAQAHRRTADDVVLDGRIDQSHLSWSRERELVHGFRTLRLAFVL